MLSIFLITLSCVAPMACSESNTSVPTPAEPPKIPVAATNDVAEAAVTAPREIFRRAMEYVAGLEGISVSVEMVSESHLSSGVSDAEARGFLALSGKDKAFVRVSNGMEEAELYSDGTDQFIYFINQKQYIKQPAPKDRADIVGAMSGGPTRQGSLWLGKYLHNAAELPDGLQDIQFLGPESLDGTVVCDKLKLVYSDYELTLWISQGDAPLPQRFEMDLSRAYSKMGLDTKIIVRFTFTGWETNPAFAADRFVFTPPEGVTEKTAQQPGKPADPHAAMLGKTAPAVELGLLGGANFSLADHKDRDVVILEFWATWCGPCRQAMPLLSEVANAYADKNVVLYAINLKESPEQVQRFVDQMKFMYPVALDKTGSVQAHYLASSIPQTVLIGKDGTIQAIHRGFSPYLRKQISEELDKLIAGESLTGAK